MNDEQWESEIEQIERKADRYLTEKEDAERQVEALELQHLADNAQVKKLQEIFRHEYRSEGLGVPLSASCDWCGLDPADHIHTESEDATDTPQRAARELEE